MVNADANENSPIRRSPPDCFYCNREGYIENAIGKKSPRFENQFKKESFLIENS